MARYDQSPLKSCGLERGGPNETVRPPDWSEPRVLTGASEPEPARAEWLWPLFGLALLGAFLAFVVDDYPLRTLIAGN
jgi:hypothetical protein